MAKVEAPEFSVVAVRTEGDIAEDTIEGFADAFTLDRETARQVLSVAPVVVKDGLTKSDIKTITTTLTELSRSGIEFRVTARDTRGLPRVADPGGMGQPPIFDMANRAFACPSCGEAFLFKAQSELRLENPA